MDKVDGLAPLRILFVGSGVGDHFWALHVNRYSHALALMGHEVVAHSWRELQLMALSMPIALVHGYDLVMLQDTHLPLPLAMELRHNNRKTVLLTHSEAIQGVRDKPYIAKLQPAYIFTDSPYGVELFEPLGFPVMWMGHGADHACYKADEKDIDVLWIGNKYTERDGLVLRQVAPLLELRARRVLMHGSGYMHGAVFPSVMFMLLARSKVVIHIGHPVTYTAGYSGTRISDALASGAFVVSTKYPRAEERYPAGVAFVDDDAIFETVVGVLERWPEYERAANLGYRYVRRYRMARDDMRKVLGAVC